MHSENKFFIKTRRMKMIHFEGIEQCSCKKSFEWAITKPEKNGSVWGYTDKLNKNVCGIVETPNGYSTTLKCPNCGAKICVTKPKDK